MITATGLAVLAVIVALGSGAILFTGGSVPTPLPVVSPSPGRTTDTVAPSVDRGAFRAVVVRPVDDGVDVVLAGADGRERLLRHVTPADLGIDPRYTLGPAGGGVSPQGWLELWADDGGPDQPGLAHFGLGILVDLADPARAPIVVLGNGFMSGRWGPDGLWAHYCAGLQPPSMGHPSNESDETVGLPDCGMPQGTEVGIGGSAVRVLRPDLGVSSEIIVPYVETFGGGPEIFWTADGSGFLGHDGTEWGVTPLDGGPFRPGAPRLLTRELDLDVEHGSVYRSRLGDPGSWKMPGTGSGLVSATVQGAQLAADGNAVWQLLVDPADPSPQAFLARLTGPGTVESVRAFDLPVPAGAFTLSADDTFVALGLAGPADAGCPECGTPVWDGFVLAPMGRGDATVTAGPAIEGDLAGLVPAVIADSWPGG
jgi:hypothetical protein